MNDPVIEANRDRVTITGSSSPVVIEAIQRMFLGLTAAYIDFTSPVRQADGQFVATGHVRLTDAEYEI